MQEDILALLRNFKDGETSAGPLERGREMGQTRWLWGGFPMIPSHSFNDASGRERFTGPITSTCVWRAGGSQGTQSCKPLTAMKLLKRTAD